MVSLHQKDSDLISSQCTEAVWQDICACILPRGVSSSSCEGVHSNPSPEKSVACMIDVLNVKEKRVAIHQVFSHQHACFCSIMRLRGKDSSRKQASPEMICEIQADRQTETKRAVGWWREIKKCKQKWNWLPSRKFSFALERGSTKMNKLINKAWLLLRAFWHPLTVESS